MASKNLINIGLSPDSGTGDSARRGGEKINNLFADIYANLGDNPVITNTNDPNYGTRQVFGETEFKVGEIHSAGKYSLVRFGLPSASVSTPAGGYNFNDVSIDNGWFFLSRGDSIGAIDSDGSVINLVLPLAVVGDVVRVKDVSNTWSGKTIKVWTTPYENSLNEANWKSKTIGVGSLTKPDSNSVSITYTPRNTTTPAKVISPYKKTDYIRPFGVTTPATWPGTSVNLAITSLQRYTELEFVYHGPQYGWHMIQKLGVDEFQDYISRYDSDLNTLNSSVGTLLVLSGATSIEGGSF